MSFIAPTDYGTDIAGVTGLDASLGIVSGNTCLVQCLARGLLTQRGTYPGAPNWGEDLRGWLNDTMTPTRLLALRSATINQLEKDERVISARVAASFDSTSGILSVHCQVEAGAGPFTMTLAVTQVTVALLNLSSS